MNETGIVWTSVKTYVDVDTGKQLRYKDANDKNQYIIINTKKETEINEHKTRGIIKYTRECRKQPQLKLNLD